MTQRYLCLFTCLALAAVGGCQGGKPPTGPKFGPVQPVHGTITFPGKTPLIGGIITFTPKEVDFGGGKMRYKGSSVVDDKGQYAAGLNDGRGLVLGEYNVNFEPRELGELPNSNIDKIPSSFALTVNVEDKDNTIDIEIK